MIIIPAIDLRGGKCVRLMQGDYERQIEYAVDPVTHARLFQQEGASWLHVVDLDGAKDGQHFNLETLLAIKQATNLNIEVGGGVRSDRAVQNLLAIGINRTIIGTRALEDPKWFTQVVNRYPNRVVLGLDAKDGKIATHGWTKVSEMTVKGMVKQFNSLPLAAIIYTDISRDGMMAGPNLEATRELAESCEVPIIASGGVGSLEHIQQLAQLPIEGVIVGRALYEKKFTVAEAIATISR